MTDADRPAVALSIAGTDPSGGAGIQADLKTFTARGVYGTTAITALVAQNTHGVSRVYPIAEDFVAEQLASVLEDIPVEATKSGMLGSPGLVELVAQHRHQTPMGFYILDPVMVATSGHQLLAPDAVRMVREQLLPTADLITPNLPEAALLLGEDVAVAQTRTEMRQQTRELANRGPGAVLLTGGHGHGDQIVDMLTTTDGHIIEFPHPRVATANTHGTGCTLSAAITADVAVRTRAATAPCVDPNMLTAAVSDSLDYLVRALTSAAGWRISRTPDGAHGPVDHLVDATAQPGRTGNERPTHYDGGRTDGG